MKKKRKLILGIIFVVICVSIFLLINSNYLKNKELVATTDTQQSQLQETEKTTKKINEIQATASGAVNSRPYPKTTEKVYY